MMVNIDAFFHLYTKHLTDCIGEMPHLYAYGVDRVPEVLGRMRQAIEARGSFIAVNKDSPAIKRTCKELGVKMTYKAIDAYLRGEYLPNFGK